MNTPLIHPSLALLAGITLLAGLVLPAAVAGGADEASEKLAAYRGDKRVLLVFAAAESDPDYQAQQKLWANQKSGFAERDLVQLPIFAPAAAPAPLARRFGIAASQFSVILIGKDGHNAYQTDQPVTAEAIFERIDAMPMRQAEIKRQAH